MRKTVKNHLDVIVKKSQTIPGPDIVLSPEALVLHAADNTKY